jgi:hypothetical protein
MASDRKPTAEANLLAADGVRDAAHGCKNSGSPGFPPEQAPPSRLSSPICVDRVATPTTFRHNIGMGRSLLVGLSVGALSLALSGAAVRADDAPGEESAFLVKASGKTAGEVIKIGNADLALPNDVQAGSIPQSALRAELARGIGRFLQNVRVQAALDHGGWNGWRILALFAKRPDVHVAVLQVGDTILRVNGESIERPEAFKVVWDKLAAAKELTLEIERAGRISTLHYAITP